MTTTARLDSARVELSPGTQAVVPLQIRNTGQVVEGYQIKVLGAVAAWTTVEPAVIEVLYPGTATTTTVRFAPPRSSDVPAGMLDFGVRVVPFEHVDEAVTPEGVVEVLPFLDTTAELLPRTTHGRGSARHQVALDNRGNVPVSVSITAADDSGATRFRVVPQLVTVPPGTAAFSTVRLTPVRRVWRGPDVTVPFVVTVAAENAAPVLLDGTHVQTATVPPWLSRTLLALLALVALVLLLWFTVVRPAVVQAARSAVADEVAHGLPSEVLTPTSQRMTVTAAPGDRVDATPDFVVPDGATLRLTDLVLSNPQGDLGRVVLSQTPAHGGNLVVILELALENFRDDGLQFQTPIVLPSGATLTMSVQCRQPGTPPALTPPPSTCSDALVLSGLLATPTAPSEP
jgi:hypothetical protein